MSRFLSDALRRRAQFALWRFDFRAWNYSRCLRRLVGPGGQLRPSDNGNQSDGRNDGDENSAPGTGRWPMSRSRLRSLNGRWGEQVLNFID
jgi:hypothetical protein